MTTIPQQGTRTASSADGRTFQLRGGTDPALPGDLLVLRANDGSAFLGQVLEQGVGGVVLGLLGDDGAPQRGGRRPFADAAVEPASADHLEALQRSTAAALTIGTWQSGDVTVPARLRAQGFGRHSFLCGQSGSGKTYALGVILEQLLLSTAMRVVVMDPNADFVRLGEARPTTTADHAAAIGGLGARVLGSSSRDAEPLRMRFATMPRAAQAAVLRLDPLTDRGEYSTFLHLQVSGSGTTGGLDAIVQHLRDGDPDEKALGQRIENLGLPAWEVWARDLPSAWEIVDGGARLTVLDLNGFQDPHESVAVCFDLVERLWAAREGRTPTLLVIDEAHNICPAEPRGPVQVALVERLIQIAAEGRKYGLWLLLSTQRPSKIHPQVLSQCDNLVVMRMNSPGDVADLAVAFGFAPPQMLRAAQYFAQGEALVAGGFVPAPAMIRMGDRLTVEGGSDVAVPLA